MFVYAWGDLRIVILVEPDKARQVQFVGTDDAAALGSHVSGHPGGLIVHRGHHRGLYGRF